MSATRYSNSSISSTTRVLHSLRLVRSHVDVLLILRTQGVHVTEQHVLDHSVEVAVRTLPGPLMSLHTQGVRIELFLDRESVLR